jgi:hypothetical protein
MVYLHAWADFQDAAEALYARSPHTVRRRLSPVTPAHPFPRPAMSSNGSPQRGSSCSKSPTMPPSVSAFVSPSCPRSPPIAAVYKIQNLLFRLSQQIRGPQPLPYRQNAKSAQRGPQTHPRTADPRSRKRTRGGSGTACSHPVCPHRQRYQKEKAQEEEIDLDASSP